MVVFTAGIIVVSGLSLIDILRSHKVSFNSITQCTHMVEIRGVVLNFKEIFSTGTVLTIVRSRQVLLKAAIS